MKTAISVPDDVFDRAEHLSHELGMSRSEFFTTAARRYADELDSAETTRAIDAVIDEAVDEVGRNGESASGFAVAMGRRVVAAGGEDW